MGENSDLEEEKSNGDDIDGSTLPDLYEHRKPSRTQAYMLVYIRSDLKAEILKEPCPENCLDE